MHIIQEKILSLSKEYDLSKLSLRKIGVLIGDPHPQKIKYHLDQLKEANLLDIEPKKWNIKTGKLISLEDFKKNVLISIPIFGTAECGPNGVVAEEQLEGFLKTSSRIIPEKEGLFAVKATGTSMNEAKIGPDKLSIDPGDFVLIDNNRTEPDNGEYVLSVIEGSANIKKFFKDSSRGIISLVSESSGNFPPIYIKEDDNYLINGIVLDVIKNMS